jgi:methionyl-tRNA formyltransferase
VLDQLTLETQNDGEATYCSKIKKSDGRTDWTESATEIANQIRAYAEWPGTYTFWGKQKLDILSAQAMDMESDAEIGQVFKNKKDIYVKCQSGCLLLGEIKLEGKKKTLARDFVNGHQDFLGAMLG